jgi:hypothetical protein
MSRNSILRWTIVAALFGGVVSAVLGPPKPTAYVRLVRAP